MHITNADINTSSVKNGGTVTLKAADIRPVYERILADGNFKKACIHVSTITMSALFIYENTEYSSPNNTWRYYGAFYDDERNLWPYTLRISFNRDTNVFSSAQLINYGKTKRLPTIENVLIKNNTTEYTPSKDYHPATKKYVDDSIVSAIGDIVSFGVELVDELPTENISTSTVYMVPSTKTEEQNVKDEYLYTGTEWELIGTTKVDLSNYYNKQEVDEMMDNVMTKITVATDEEVYNLLHGGAV